MNRRFFCSLILAVTVNSFLVGCSRCNETIHYNRDLSATGAAESGYPKALVVYDTWSGNTQAIAEAMASNLRCSAVGLNNLIDYTISDYDLLVVGSPVHGGMPTNKIAKFLSEIEKPRASAVFVTYGAPLFGPFMADTCLDSMEEKLQDSSLGRFKCHGFHQIFRTYPDHPDNKDRKDAAQFAAGLCERWKCGTHLSMQQRRPSSGNGLFPG